MNDRKHTPNAGIPAPRQRPDTRPTGRSLPPALAEGTPNRRKARLDPAPGANRPRPDHRPEPFADSAADHSRHDPRPPDGRLRGKCDLDGHAEEQDACPRRRHWSV